MQNKRSTIAKALESHTTILADHLRGISRRQYLLSKETTSDDTRKIALGVSRAAANAAKVIEADMKIVDQVAALDAEQVEIAFDAACNVLGIKSSDRTRIAA